ncbi:MAG: hypothetical protein IJ722_07585 [Alloprevotella sp.]|nr:hypothetical protein [Alloprevotella sp.]
MRKFFAILLLLTAFCTVPVAAQKAFKPIRAYLKANNPGEALKTIEKMAADSAFAADPRLYDFGVQANVALNTALNEKIYLKQKYDTLQFFNSIYGIYDYALRCNTVELQQLAERGTPLRFANSHAQLLHKHYKNLCSGGRYFYRKQDYTKALHYLTICLDLPKMQALWGSAEIPADVNTKNAVLALRSAYMLHDYQTVWKYADLALLADTGIIRKNIIGYLVRTARAQADTLAYLKYLRLGLDENPAEPFFFTELTDYHTARGDYKASLALADEMLGKDSLNALFLTSKALSLMNLGRHREAIDCATKSQAVDSTNADTYYYLGAAYYNLASAVALPNNINTKAYRQALTERRNYYLLARPQLEKYRQLRPDDRQRWVPLLYTIYLALNQGDKFAEMERLMDEIAASN